MVFSVADQFGSSEMIMICQIPHVYTACSLQHSSTTVELPTSSVMSKENGRWMVNMVNGAFKT